MKMMSDKEGTREQERQRRNKWMGDTEKEQAGKKER